MDLQEKIKEVATPEQQEKLTDRINSGQLWERAQAWLDAFQSQQTQQTPEQEPTQPQAPQETPQAPQEVKTQEPILFSETPPTPPKQETPQAPTPRVQEIETERQEMDLKAQKDNVVSSEKQSKIDEFTWLVQGWADTNSLADFARNNPTLSKDFNAILKTHFKTRENTDFFAKYSVMSPKNVVEAVKMGKVHLYDEKYNLLPPQQRAEVERLVQMKDTLTAWEKTDFNSPEFQMNMDFDTLMTKMFAPNTAQRIEDMRNDDRLVPLTQQLNRKQAEIEALDVSMIGMQQRIEREQAGRLSNSSIRAMVRDEQQAMQLEKIAMLSEYRIIQGDIASVQADIDRDIRLLEYEDAQEKQKYAMMYDEYKTRRGEMLARTMRQEEREFQLGVRDEDRQFQLGVRQEEREFQREMTAEQRQFQVAMAEFEVMQRELAEQREVWYKKELAQFNMKLAEESLSWGNYIDDGNGNLVYVKDGRQINVLTGLGKQISQEVTKDYIWQDFHDKDTGVITTIRRDKRTGEQTVETFTENGQRAGDYIEQLWGRITSYGGKHDNYQWLDIDANVWDPIHAPFSWVIEEVMGRPWYGNTIVIRDEATGNKIRYSHLDGSLVFNPGTRFEAWAIIAKAWNSWNVLKLNGQKPTKQELAQGFWSHIDIVSITPDGRTRTSRETEEYLRGLWGMQEIQPTESFLNDLSELSAKDRIAEFRKNPWLREPYEDFIANKEQELSKFEIAARENEISRWAWVIRDIQRALELSNRAWRFSWITAQKTDESGIPKWYSTLSPAFELNQHLQSIKSNISIEQLQAMRDASPTWGALWQVPIQQQRFLMEVLWSLDPTLPQEILEQNLNYVQDIYLNAIYWTPWELQGAIETWKMTQAQVNEINAIRWNTWVNPIFGDRFTTWANSWVNEIEQRQKSINIDYIFNP